MHNSLTLPGTIPGLLRRGSPVILTEDYEPCTSWDPYLPRGRDCLALDLTDATGRAHAAWWLLQKLGETNPGARPKYHPIEVASWVRGIGWTLSHPSISPGFTWLSPDYKGVSVGTYRILECLRGLNPDDPRLLPDGSRWVDAEALRRVCLHVAGLEE